MDLEFTDDQDDLRRSVREFLTNECPTSLVRAVVEGNADLAGELWRAMVELDWPALAVPESLGGIGLGYVDVAVVAEELGAALAPGPYLPTVTQYAAALAAAGTDDQRARWLPDVARGLATGALAVCDHPARWTPGDVTARAEPRGDTYVLSGTKHLVMAGPDVTNLVVAARLAGSGDLALFVVPAGGVQFHPVRALDASRPLSTVVLDGTAVPADHRLGPPGAGPADDALHRVLQEAAVALALEIVGACRSLFDLTVAYAADRQQFGVPIGSFQAVKHKLADCLVTLQRAQALAYYAVAALAEDAGDRAVAAAMAKAAADDCQAKVAQEAIQTLGGIGFTWEHDAHLYVKRARSSAMLFGSATDHRRTVARLTGVTTG